MFISNLVKAFIRYVMKRNVKVYPLLKLGYCDRELFK